MGEGELSIYLTEKKRTGICASKQESVWILVLPSQNKMTHAFVVTQHVCAMEGRPGLGPLARQLFKQSMCDHKGLGGADRGQGVNLFVELRPEFFLLPCG